MSGSHSEPARRGTSRAGAGRRRSPGRRALGWLGRLLAGLLVLLGGAVLLSQPDAVRGAVMEAGDTLRLDMFMNESVKDGGLGQDLFDITEDTSFGPGVAAIDTTRPGRYEVQILHRGAMYRVPLLIEDTTAPAADAKPLTRLYDGVRVDVYDCLENIRDVTAVTAVWAQEPDIERDGEQTAVARLTDEAGNSTDVTVPVTIIHDTTAPVIQGAHDIDIFLGDSIAYRDGVTVTDDIDPNPTLTIDNSGVDLNAEGTYTATYTAADQSGNTSSVSVTVTITKKIVIPPAEQEVYALAQPYYDDIITDDMTDMEKAFAIYWWVLTHINYRDSSDHASWTDGARQAFTKRYGDCFTFFAAAKCLLNMAGIENLDVVKSDTSHSSHFWLLINLGYGWYHFDACPRLGSGDNFFMVTDEELEAYSSRHYNSHVFDHSLYPERATQSVQDKISYSQRKILEP